MLKLFSGTNNLALSKRVINLLKRSLAQSEVVRFEDSEVRVRVLEDVENQTAIIIQPFSNPTDTSIIELLFFADALRRGEAKKVIAIIPYLGYARQNIQHRKGEAISIHVIVKCLEAVGIDEVIALDLHDEAIAGIFSIPLTHLTALPLLVDHIKKYLKKENISEESVVVMSPDQGGIERARKFAESFYGTKEAAFGIVEKQRDLEHIHKSQALKLYADVEGKTVILVDDIVTSGRTLMNAADLSLQKGATNVIAAVVHHDFSAKAPKKLQDSKIEKFFTTDTIRLEEKQKFPKLEEISIAPLLGEEIKKSD